MRKRVLEIDTSKASGGLLWSVGCEPQGVDVLVEWYDMGESVVGSKLRRRRADAERELDRLLSVGAIESVYQPIVKLKDDSIVAFEALARGPQGSILELPPALFGAAARHDRLEELDWACRAAAISGAFGADYLPPAALFVNVEPLAAGQAVPEQYAELMARSQSGLRVVFEFTERALTDYPADVLYAVRGLRELGAMIALDDVGVDPRSVALLPFLEPEVVKLDMSLIQRPPTPAALATFAAVSAFAEQTGALVVAEGIESDRHLQTALALGATHGQGWRYGRPGPLPASDSWQPVELFDAVPRNLIDINQTPFDWLDANGARRGLADAEELYGLWAHLVSETRSLGEAAVIIAAPGPIAPARALHGFSDLAAHASFVGALQPATLGPKQPGIRIGHLDDDEPLTAQACISVLAPHFAATLAARPAPGSDGFEYRITHDRPTAACAARRLMVRIDPQR